jgi:diguanylate cyclase (GGDEF)-like protein
MAAAFPVIYLFLGIVVSTILCTYAWRNPRTRGNRAFAAACFISILWMVGDVISRASETFAWEWIGEVVRYFAVPILPVALLVFIYQYCGKNISRRTIKLLLVVPLISWLMFVTNPWHNLFFSSVSPGAAKAMEVSYGTYFWLVHLPYSYGLMLLGFIAVLMEFSRASRFYRKQIGLLLFSLCIPFLSNVLVVAKVVENFTPLTFPVFFTVMGYAIFRHRFLGSNPIAYETIFQKMRDGVMILDRDDVIRDINLAAAEKLSKKTSEAVGRHVREALENLSGAAAFYDKNPKELGEIEIPLGGAAQYLLFESTPLAISPNHSEGRIITIRDVTDHYRHKLSLEAMAFHDPLTRLANRRKFQEEVERAIKKAAATGETLAILYFDLNRFKTVNDTLGHETGDELLKYVAARVASILRKPDILARLGGDEFALLLHDCDENGIDLVVERIMENVRRPFKVGEHTLVADLSLGAAFYPKDGENLTELLRRADLEMYRAKQKSGDVALPNIRLDSPTNLEM